jgi:hypothetical protein
MLDSKEFKDRSVGTVFVPYVKGDEVWGIAKIFDAGVAELMNTIQTSTSPGVILFKHGMKTVGPQDAEHLLIEGPPSLLDHIAIGPLGVWDKGGAPSGVASTLDGENNMPKTTEEMEAEEKAHKDSAEAAPKEPLDKLLAKVDAMCDSVGELAKRVDSMESARKDAEEMEAKAKKDADDMMAADKAKKDAEEEEAKKAKADKKDGEGKEELEEKLEGAKADAEEARKDSQTALAAVESLRALIPAQMTDAEYASRADAQVRFDSVFQAHGESAPRALVGESDLAYRARMLTSLKRHHPTWKEVEIAKLDAQTLAVAEPQIFDAALQASRNPTDVPDGTLRQIVKRQQGRDVTEFFGDSGACWGRFKSPVRQTKAGLEGFKVTSNTARN